MTGPMLHFRYAVVCAPSRLANKKITVEQYEKLMWYLRTGEEPDTSFLNECFPAAGKEKKEFANSRGLDEWAPETVQEFWWYNHGRSGNCAVRFGNVVNPKLINNLVSLEEDCLLTVICINLFKINLKIGDEVTFHHLHVIEVIK